MSSLFQELKRRNVFRVGLAYLAVAWLVLQAADIVLDNINAPEWLMQALMLFMVIGLPVALVFAWAFEVTPEGIKPESEVDRSDSITQETGHKLNRTITAVLIAAVAFLLVDKFLLVDDTPDVITTEKSVAVLPFVAMSRGEDDEYFADGLTEEILNSLTRVPELLVTARTSAFFFKGKDIPIPEIAEKLGVAHIVEGSVRRDGDRLRVTAQLIRASDGFHLWSENYDRETEDTFGVQADIAEKISEALDVVLDDKRRERMHASGLRNPEAFVAYQKGVKLFTEAHNTPDRLDVLREANAFFEQAVALAPNLADAYTRHADYFTHYLADNSTNPDVTEAQRAAAFAQIQEDLGNALQFAPDDALRFMAAWDLAVVSGNWRELPALYDARLEHQACHARPNWGEVASEAFGKATESLSMAMVKVKCDPLLFGAWMRVISANIWLGDFDAAIELAEKGMKQLPHRQIAQRLASANIGAGRFDKADSIIGRDLRDDRLRLNARMSLAAAQGDSVTLEQLIPERLARHEVDRTYPINVLAQAGEREIVNQMAAELDAAPYGYLRLMTYPVNCFCGATWDLEVTPNFAKLLEDADLAWPPESPINWPLKDW
ncbi:MAG: hypothetical protein GWP62_01300 [Gammaproteobacteria bacterium]|jgi:TolB-like protein|nr:hypothetical protein [Gammaproteobacteria bacterium]